MHLGGRIISKDSHEFVERMLAMFVSMARLGIRILGFPSRSPKLTPTFSDYSLSSLLTVIWPMSALHASSSKSSILLGTMCDKGYECTRNCVALSISDVH